MKIREPIGVVEIYPRRCAMRLHELYGVWQVDRQRPAL